MSDRGTARFGLRPPALFRVAQRGCAHTPAKLFPTAGRRRVFVRRGLLRLGFALLLIAPDAATALAVPERFPPTERKHNARQAAGTPASAQQPAPGRPLNPTQEVAKETPEGAAVLIGPAELRVGGYLGLTGLYRSSNGGGGTGTGFASIPYADSVQGNVSEARLSAQSSRLSLRIDAKFDDERPSFRKLAGYFEMDFNGSVSGTVAVTSTSAGFRLRHAFGEVQYGETLYMGLGQAFSLMTPQKDQISMWPSDVEMSQAVDTSYLAGMVWARVPQFRLAWRPTKQFNWAFSAENPEQELGKSIVALPSCCARDLEAQYNTGSNELQVPNLTPDFVTRVAFNPTGALHVDFGGVLRVFRHTIAPYDRRFTATGGGGNINGRLHVTRGTRVIGQFAVGSGLGRYIGALVPDVSFRADSRINPLSAKSWVAGLERKVSSNVSLAAYYSGVVTDASVALDVDGRYIGFGFPGSSGSHNRSIDEITVTGSLLSFKSSDRGSAQINVQASWLERRPWHPGSSGARSASMFLFFVQARYNLP